MAWKSGGAGNYRIDRRYPEIGRLQISSGTTNDKQFKVILTMLDSLASDGRFDDLKAIQQKVITPLAALTKWKTGTLKGSDSIKLALNLKGSIIPWLDNYDIADTTRVAYRNLVNQLLKLAKKDSTIADSPTLLNSYRVQCQKNTTPKSFNQCRAVLLSFTRDKYGKKSPIYNAVNDIELLNYKKGKMNNPFTVKELFELLPSLEENVGKMALTMCTTGMGPKEYINDGFMIQADRIIVHGEKNEHRNDREIPIVYQPFKPDLQYKAFRQHIQKAAPKHTLYDFRRTYAVWMESAGILESHRNSYMGHSASKMSDLYLVQDLEKYLVQDADTLRTWIETERKKKVKNTPIVFTAPQIPAFKAKPKKRIFQIAKR